MLKKHTILIPFPKPNLEKLQKSETHMDENHEEKHYPRYRRQKASVFGVSRNFSWEDSAPVLAGKSNAPVSQYCTGWILSYAFNTL